MVADHEFIIGFDILPSYSPRSRTRPKFACAVVCDGIVVSEHEEISRRDLIRLVQEIKPIYIATDNIFEIVPDTKSIFALMNRFPFETKLVQVTGVPPKQVSIKSLARKFHFPLHGKPTPLEAARLSAILASKGVGYFLECFGEQTEIKVTRGRKMGRGGQSANRYRRKLHSEIQQMTRHIESVLKEAEIDYDIDVRTSDFGYSSSRIIAYAPLPVIKGLVESKRGGDFNVLVTPVRKRAEFLPLEPTPITPNLRPRYFIMGIDPGTTAAVCLLTFAGTIRLLKSRKGLTRADIIRLVYEHGVPVIVATDTTPVPHFVKKLASTLSANLFVPNKPIPVSEKQEIARVFSESSRISNAHERDALTAAVYAYRDVLPKLQQIDRKIRDEQIQVDRNHVKALVLKGMSLSEAIAQLVHVESDVVEVPEPEFLEEPLTQERFDALRARLSHAETKIEDLSERVDDLARLIEYHKFRESELTYSLEIINRENYWRVKRDREVSRKESELKTMKREVHRLQKQVKRLSERIKLLRGVRRREMRGDMIAVKVIPHFTRESIEDYIRTIGLRAGDIVLFEDASGGGPQTAGMLIERRIRAVIVNSSLSHLAENELVRATIPVIKADVVDLQRIDEFAFISRKRFEQQFQGFMRVARELARQQGEEELVELVESYRRRSLDDF
ncbi:MAG: DUF460 domain-containing protein [Candidatus Thorarchaeota archaeon]|nr:DUF460 domain-containing protein [Candidatus Thorarchaeota archaeon]